MVSTNVCGQDVPFGTSLLFRCRQMPSFVLGVEICEDLWSALPPSTFQMCIRDRLYGHRRDVAGYAAAATEFDRFVADFIPGMREGDLLMVTADHGCDPSLSLIHI